MSKEPIDVVRVLGAFTTDRGNSTVVDLTDFSEHEKADDGRARKETIIGPLPSGAIGAHRRFSVQPTIAVSTCPLARPMPTD